MSLSFFEVDPKLRFLVNSFFFIKNTDKNNKLYDKFIPNGYSGLVIHFHRNVSLIKSDNTIILPEYFFTYPAIQVFDIRCLPPFDSLIILFNTSILTGVFGYDFDKKQENNFIEEDFVGLKKHYDELKLMDDENRIKFVEDFLLKNEKVINYKPDIIDKIYSEILEDAGITPIENILFKYNVNDRSLRRNFLKRVGINAKKLARISRVNLTWEMLNRGELTDYQSIIYGCNYTDQAHFIKDFKKMTGETPGKFFNRDLTEVAIISGRQKE